MFDAVAKLFPRFAARADEYELEHVLPPATPADIMALEQSLGLPLPQSYKDFLLGTRGFWLMDGLVQFGRQHPFFHDFPPLEALTSRQREVVSIKGGSWPPASQGMLCFAEFVMEADGDQVLFDVSKGLIAGEYPVMYWAHEGRPPAVRRLADSFTEFMEQFLDYPAFENELD